MLSRVHWGIRRVLLFAFLFLTVCGSALAAKPAIPKSEQSQMKAVLRQIGAGDLALVPTSLPPHFAFESFSITGSPLGIDVSLTDQRFLKTPTAARVHEISFDAAYFKGTCSRNSRQTLRVASEAVYTDGKTVWRCVRTSKGHLVRMSAHGLLANTALAVLVASARPVG